MEALKYGGKNIGVLIIGAGKIGIELVKNCIWLGQLGKDYILKVVVFDRDADAISERFFIEHPEIQKNYNLTFKQITMLSNNFEAELNKIYEDINYVCICLGNDNLNIRVALFMRRFFMKKNSSPNRPFIAVET
ncbi:hypothetical protein, partial [uncultured Methanobrevibacter sp.]|uniref:hypothetical protein n=1 Tax=uncultured Methanobrevibacter sp. TaxID=253161 RepID=UPI00261534EC